MPHPPSRGRRLTSLVLVGVAVFVAVETALVLFSELTFVVAVGLRIAAFAVVGLIVLGFIRYGGSPEPTSPNPEGEPPLSATATTVSDRPGPSEPNNSPRPE